MTEIVITSEEQLERELDIAKLDNTQKKIFNELTQIFIDAFELPPLVIRGFYLRALIDWQKSIDMTVEDTETSLETTFEVRKKQQIEIFDFFKNRIRRVLKSKNKDQLLESTVAKGLNHYLKNYANR